MSAPAPKTFSTTALAAMLSKSVGDDVALATVSAAMERLRMSGGELSGDDAIALLAEIAEGDGVIAVAARFVRSRLIAQLSREALQHRER